MNTGKLQSEIDFLTNLTQWCTCHPQKDENKIRILLCDVICWKYFGTFLEFIGSFVKDIPEIIDIQR